MCLQVEKETRGNKMIEAKYVERVLIEMTPIRYSGSSLRFLRMIVRVNNKEHSIERFLPDDDTHSLLEVLLRDGSEQLLTIVREGYSK